MMKYFYFLLILFMISCSDSDDNETSILPQACFIKPTEGHVGQSLLFSSECSKNAVEYNWDFGDGKTSEGANPSHIYTATGNYEVQLTVTGVDQSTHQYSEAIEIAPAPKSAIKTYFGDITEDAIWKAGTIHKIFGFVNIMDATITIEPGAVVMFMEGAELNIGTSDGVTAATLIANGTAEHPIIFTADSETPTPGYWDLIKFGGGDSGNSSLKHCTIEYGGGWTSMIAVVGTQISIENCIIQKSASNGISFGDVEGFIFNNNTVTDCGNYAMALNPNLVHKIGNSNHFGADAGIGINSGSFTLPTALWPKQDCPYFIGSLVIGGVEPASLTIEPGTIIKAGGGITVIESGQLIAEGTIEEPIIFTTSDAPTSWKGIIFSGSTSTSSLQHATIEYASVTVNNTQVHINNCLLQYGYEYAINCNEEGSFASFENNTVNNPDYNGIKIYGNWAHTIGSTNEFIAKNGIEVAGGYITNESVVWEKQPCPYFVSANLLIGGETSSMLTIEPGTTIAIGGGMTIEVGDVRYRSDQPPVKGGLIAHGTVEEPIIFTSAKAEPAPGDWNYINFTSTATESGVLQGSGLSNCIIEYGGFSYDGAILISNTDVPSITNCTIQYAEYYGITTFRANPTFENNVFIGNGMADYYHYY